MSTKNGIWGIIKFPSGNEYDFGPDLQSGDPVDFCNDFAGGGATVGLGDCSEDEANVFIRYKDFQGDVYADENPERLMVMLELFLPKMYPELVEKTYEQWRREFASK